MGISSFFTTLEKTNKSCIEDFTLDDDVTALMIDVTALMIDFNTLLYNALYQIEDREKLSYDEIINKIWENTKKTVNDVITKLPNQINSNI